MSIYKGSTLLAGNVSNGDAVTINTNSNDLLQAIGTINKNTSSFNYKYDWVGTFAQWQAQEIATTHPEWVCYIIDDSYDGVSVPTGTILPFGGVNAPEGFLICDGSAVSRTTYSKLFNVIGESYGSGDGNSTFNIPNYNDRVLQGSGTRGVVGTTIEAGLPNITGSISSVAYETQTNGALVINSLGEYGQSGGSAPLKGATLISFNASNSTPIYGNSDTVQPNALLSNMIIKY